LPLQLDRGLLSDEQIPCGSDALHGYGGLRDQALASHADERPGFPFS
jgi:hypothetical protein